MTNPPVKAWQLVKASKADPVFEHLWLNPKELTVYWEADDSAFGCKPKTYTQEEAKKIHALGNLCFRCRLPDITLDGHRFNVDEWLCPRCSVTLQGHHPDLFTQGLVALEDVLNSYDKKGKAND
jgi:hypothetical protein